MLESKLPFDDELENSLLGVIISDNDVYDGIAKYFNDTSIFGQSKARLLWNKISYLKRQNKKFDLISICSQLTSEERKKGLTNFYITSCLNESATSESADYYATLLYEKYLMRKVITQISEIEGKASGNYIDVYDTISNAHSLFGELLELKPSSAKKIDDIVEETLASINNKETKLISTGFQNLNRFAGGLTRGEITIIGGRPGHGKTTVMINMLANALADGKRAIFFSRELPNSELIKKILCLESHELSYSMVRKNVYTSQEREIVDKTIKLIKQKYHEDKFLMFDNLRDFATSSGEVKKFKPDIVFDDYIQLISCSGKEEQRRLQIEKLVNDYKWLAKETDAAIVLASQLNRGIEYRDKSYEPQLSDLAESGAIEQVAENVFFTHYDYKVKGEAGKGKNILTISAKKVRYGDTGSVDLGYDGDKCKVYNSMGEMIEYGQIQKEEIPF
tara:strand:- start:243 stop:1589 length:1347 start_codon:yes stop_codon:yes gene_type:complete